MGCLFSIPLSIFNKRFLLLHCILKSGFTEIWFHDRFDLFDLFNLAFLDAALTRSTRYIGIAKSFKLKPCRTNYPHDSTRPIWNQLQFLKPVQCVCTLLLTCSLNIDLAGECGMIVGPHSTKLPQSWDTGSDQPSVPASDDSNRLS